MARDILIALVPIALGVGLAYVVTRWSEAADATA